MSKITNYINHIVFVVDRSGSMRSLTNEVVKVFDTQVEHLAKRSKELDQETRVTTYLFNDKADCLVYDKDVLRLPSLKSFYDASGNTALVDATLKAIEDLQKTPELYGDHSFLIYVLSDGEENSSKNLGNVLSNKIKDLPENWTIAALVPDANGVYEAKRFGFPANNIQQWTTDGAGLKEAGEVIKKATDTYMYARSTGLRGTKCLFTLDASSLSKTQVKNALCELSPSEYNVFLVRGSTDKEKMRIKYVAESWSKQPYRVGSAYYQLVKPETIQASKNICIMDVRNGKVYSGRNARKLLGLPDYEVKVNPSSYGDYTVFVQSTSVNRLLVPNTQLIVLS
jgi:hypothetical protein